MADNEATSSSDNSSGSEKISALIGRGKKHLVCNEVMEAVDCFGEASSLAAAKYGHSGDECAESYYLYGTALLELSRMENGVLGNALTGVKVEEEGSDDEFVEAEGPKISEISEEEKSKVKTDVLEAMEAEDVVTKGKDDALKASKEEEKSEEKKESEQKEDKEKDKEDSGEAAKGGKEQEEKMDTEEKEAKEEKEKKDKEVSGESTKEGEGSEDKMESEEKDEKVEDEKKETEGDDKDNKDKTDEDKEGEDLEEEEGDEEDEEGDESSAQEKTETTDDVASETEENKGDDIPTLQLAWESLSIAKYIYNSQEGTEAKKKEGQSLEKLGEISLEQEQYSQAITDFKACLEIVQKIYEPENRALAEIHYNLGLAHSFDNKFDEAITHYKKSVETIKLKIKTLEEKIAKAEEGKKGKEKADDDDPCQADKKEVKELQALLPEITAKIEDAEEMKKSAATMAAVASDAIKMTMGVPSDGVSSGAFDSGFGLEESSAEIKTKEKQGADDITHLVKRKRKPKDETSEDNTKDEIPAKRSRPADEEKTNGDANGNDAEPVQNGDSTVKNGEAKPEPVTV